MWKLFLSALFGLLAGLVASGFQAHLQNKQRREDRLERRREFKREKAEQVFREVSDLRQSYHDSSLHALRLLSQGEKVEAPPTPSNSKVSALLLVYFPDCVPLLNDLDRDMRSIVEKYANELREGDTYKNPDKIKGIHVLLAHESAQRVSRFTEDLRPKLQAEISQLW